MGELLTEHDGGGGVDGDGFRGTSPSRCGDRDFCPPNWSFAMVAAPLESFWSFVKWKDVERAFGVLQAQFAIVRYPALSWSHDQMWEVMQACVIMHNMIIEDDRKNHARTHVGPYECEGPLAEVDHELPADFANFLAMHAEIRDSNVHDQLQADLVEHLWRIKGNAAAP
ncbi:hypothetical protein QYE76_051604 [Lolium multiflorum]|uniref:Nuclease HARBI1 n=1 Tax=Lolium multiflorum TaxID=4521 RepID=A0AAD8WKQ0_LOLMU|nr:hypothetical protein QYE76_051604 [Lolium multiflorum]